MLTYYMSSPRITVKVLVKNGVIVGGAPVINRFVGQRMEKLRAWMGRHGEVRIKLLKSELDD